MYSGKNIARGDMVFVFDSENEGGRGPMAHGGLKSSEAVAKVPG